MSKILVTGGAGFIGSHIVDHFISKGDEVVVFDNLSSGNEENINSDAWFFSGDVRDKDALDVAMEGVDYVFHEAALVSVPKSFENPAECLNINVEGTRNVFESALKNNVKKVVIASSAAVYGDNPNLPLKENEDLKPMSPYAESKLKDEELAKEYSSKSLPVVALRYFNVYGPRQDPSSPYSGVISIFMDKVSKGEDIVIFGDGLQTRDFINVKDVVKANVLALELESGEYNVATGTEVTIKELAEKVIEKAGSNSKIIFKEARQGDIRKSIANIDKISSFGFDPSKKLDLSDI
ncbi:dTDP-glucose 4,6-dehydratase [Candidatus Woesearchaeota archaeon]|nr:MAG: dTDP-glucose 4,6-dehydratase [Candidatus Woesearchaeota archaeon]